MYNDNRTIEDPNNNDSNFDSIQKEINNIKNLIDSIISNYDEGYPTKPNQHHLSSIRESLNVIFPDNKCLDVLYTENTDNPFFGIRINPVISSKDCLVIISSDESFKLNKYQLEFDSKLFNIGLNADSIASYLLYDISSMMTSDDGINKLRAYIDLYAVDQNEMISIRDSISYAQLIIFVIKDTLTKLTSLLYLNIDASGYDSYVIQNSFINDFNLQEPVLVCLDTIANSLNGFDGTVNDPKPYILRWVFVMYNDIKNNLDAIVNTLRDAKKFTGSFLDKSEIDKTLNSVDKIDVGSITEGSLISLLENVSACSKLNEASLFKKLKKNGLRSIEDDLYEVTIRLKNCEDEAEAMYILRFINTRIDILEDYLYGTADLSDREREHWQLVVEKYMDLRDKLASKRILNKKQYGLFFDYDQLDNLDK